MALNPCYEPGSCIPEPPPAILGDVELGGPTCSYCPSGTEDMDPTQPGRQCMDIDGCMPNLCNDPSQCTDVLHSNGTRPGESIFVKYC